MQSLQFSFPEIFYLFGAFHGFVLAFYLALARKGHFANRFLIALLILFSFYLFENTMYSSGYLGRYPHLLFTTLPLIYLLAPLFYLYVSFTVNPVKKLKIWDCVHLAPFLFELGILLPLYSLPAAAKTQIYETMVNSTPSFQFSVYFIGYIVYIGSSLFYMFRTYQQVLENNNVAKGWVKNASIVYSLYITLSLMLSMSMFANSEFKDAAFHINLFMQTLLIQAVGYLTFHSPGIFQSSKNNNGKKYLYSSLTQPAIEAYKREWTELMDAQQPYLNPDLSPEYFERHLKISKHHLSQLMTEGFNSNFYDLINSYRVANAKRLLQEVEYQEAKILHIAFDCGFSNKSTFLRSFKKNTGLTPTEFRKKANNLVSRN